MAKTISGASQLDRWEKGNNTKFQKMIEQGKVSDGVIKALMSTDKYKLEVDKKKLKLDTDRFTLAKKMFKQNSDLLKSMKGMEKLVDSISDLKDTIEKQLKIKNGNTTSDNRRDTAAIIKAILDSKNPPKPEKEKPIPRPESMAFLKNFPRAMGANEKPYQALSRFTRKPTVEEAKYVRDNFIAKQEVKRRAANGGYEKVTVKQPYLIRADYNKMKHEKKAENLKQKADFISHLSDRRFPKKDNKMVELLGKSLVFLGSLITIAKVIETLKKAPSMFGAMVDLLSFGFVFLLKPLADFLGMILKPIAIYLIKFDIWLNGLNKWIKYGVAVLEGFALAFLAWIGKIVSTEGIGKAVDAAKGLGEKVIGKAFDIGKFLLDFITGKFDLGKWITEHLPAKVIDIAEMIKGKITGAFDVVVEFGKFFKNKAIDAYKFIKELIFGKAKNVGVLEEDLLKITPVFDGLIAGINKVTTWVTENLLGKGLKAITSVIENHGIDKAFAKLTSWITGEGLGTLFKILGVLDHFFTVSFIAEILSWITGWVASLLPADSPFGAILDYISKFTGFVGELLDPVSKIVAAIKDIWNCLHGDFSFSNSIDCITSLVDSFNTQLDSLRVVFDVMPNVFKNIMKVLSGQMSVSDFIKSTVTGDTSNKTSSMQGSAGKAYISALGKSAGAENSAANMTDGVTIPTNNKNIDSKTGFYVSGISGIKGFATGGIVKSPVNAIVGEKGTEAIIPLSQIGSVMKNINGVNNGQQPINIQFSGFVDEQKMRTLIQQEATKIFNSHKKVSGAMW